MEKSNSFHRDMTISAIRAEEGEGRKVTLSFSSEEPYERFFGPEILDHSEGAVDLSRLNSIGCVLYNHNRDKVIGKITRAWVENGRGKAEVEFDDDPESDTIYKKVKSGSLKGVSVGYMVNMKEAEDVRAGKKSRLIQKGVGLVPVKDHLPRCGGAPRHIVAYAIGGRAVAVKDSVKDCLPVQPKADGAV